jgi:hypothetical protein
LSRPATDVQKDYINLISLTRRMKRDVNKLMEIYKGQHGNPFAKSDNPEDIYGHEGEYFARDDGEFGQTRDESIINYNSAPGESGFLQKGKFGQPGLWCQWEINENGTELRWDGGEKFYNYVEWLKYLIAHFFEPWGIKLNGQIDWEGENPGDKGQIVVNNNEVKIYVAKITTVYIEEGSDTED